MKPLSGPEEKLLFDAGGAGNTDLDTYLQAVNDVFMGARGSPASGFETQTAKCLFDAYRQSHSPEVGGKFVAVSAATGAAKTLSALGMMVHLHRKGLSGALVMREIAEVEKSYCLLTKLLPAQDIAVWSSIHNRKAPKDRLWKYERDEGLIPSARFDLYDCQRARIMLTTHHRWQDEIAKQADHGVYLREGERRELVIVDEEPELDRVYSFTTEHLDELATFVSDSRTEYEQLALGMHPVESMVATLRTIHRRAAEVVDARQGRPMSPCELVTPGDLSAIAAFDMVRIDLRLDRLAGSKVSQENKVKKMQRLVEALKVAAQGRLFFARDTNRRGVFHAYGMPVPPQERTVILDGTADLNEFYRLSGSVHVIEAGQPDYRNVRITVVNPPTHLKGRLRPTEAYRNRSAAELVMTYLQSLLRDVTTAGDKVLVHAKKDFLDKFTEDEVGRPEKGIMWEGRCIYFVNFGRGRGSNLWRDCTVHVRLGDHHLPKEVLTARLGSLGAVKLDDKTLRVMGTPKPNLDAYWAVKESFVLLNQKQDAARTAIRNFDDDGVAAAARLYMVDCNVDLLAENLWRLFPGNSGLHIRNANDEGAGRPVKGKRDKTRRLLELVLSTEKSVLEREEILEVTGLDKSSVWKVIDSALAIGTAHRGRGDGTPVSSSLAALSEALRQRGWTKTTRKALGLPGKGYALCRDGYANVNCAAGAGFPESTPQPTPQPDSSTDT